MKGVPGFEQALARYLEIKAQGKNEKPVASSSKLIASSSKTIAGSSKLAPAKKRTPSAIKTETDTVALDSSDALPKSAKRKRSEKKPKSKELVEDSDDSTNDMVVDDSNVRSMLPSPLSILIKHEIRYLARLIPRRNPRDRSQRSFPSRRKLRASQSNCRMSGRSGLSWRIRIWTSMTLLVYRSSKKYTDVLLIR